MSLSSSFQVLVAELDCGTFFLSAHSDIIGTDELTPAVLSFGNFTANGGSLSIEAQALPDFVADEFWTNRKATLFEIDPSAAGAAYNGRMIFDGVFAAEPAESNGVLSLSLILPRRKLITVPTYGVIDAATYPLAPAASQGRQKPLIFGTVEDCPLLPVSIPEYTTLNAVASAGDTYIDVADATKLAASGSVVIDGQAYSYSAKADKALLGMAITRAHRPGTLVAQSGSAVFLAAGHALTGLSALKAGGELLSGATIDLPNATATFASVPSIVTASVRMNESLQFDALGTGNTALNGTNAIRFAVVQVSANATALPAAINANTDPLLAIITFAHPSGRIVQGIYTVAFTVSIGAQIGWARVKIGTDDVVWQMAAPDSVLYNVSPVTVLLDTDTDVLPVSVEVEEGGSLNQVTVTIVSASRVVYTGNLDDANFATLRQPSNTLFRADQLTENADQGRIAKAQLVVRWFAGKGGLGVPTVKFGGLVLGVLAQTQLADIIRSAITVDVTSQGAAALPQQNISTTIAGGTASLSHATIIQNATIVPVYYSAGGGGTYRSWVRAPKMPSITGNITVIAVLANNDSLIPGGPTTSGVVNLRRADNTVIAQVSISSSTTTHVATNQWTVTGTISEVPDNLFFDSLGGGLDEAIQSVNLAWNSLLTSAVTQNNTPASGASAPLSAQNLGHSGTAVAASGGNSAFTVPAPPRVINTVFDLAGYTDWSQFTNKQIEISYAGGTGVDLCIVQAYLSVEYDVDTRIAVGSKDAPLTATATGFSGNPADVLAWLATTAGHSKIDAHSRAALAAWYTSNAYLFARRLSKITDVLQLLSYAAEQAGVVMYDSADGFSIVRWFDLSELPTPIAAADLLNPAKITWATRTENNITLNFKENYIASGFNRALIANAANNNDCRLGQLALKGEARPLTLDGGWIRADATAARYLADTAKRNAQPHRLIALQLPFTYAALTVGNLIDVELGANSFATARIISLSDDNGWIDLTAEQIL